MNFEERLAVAQAYVAKLPARRQRQRLNIEKLRAQERAAHEARAHAENVKRALGLT